MGLAKRKEGGLKYQAHQYQLKFLNLDSRFVGFIGGIGSGKTVAGALWTMQKALGSRTKGIVGTRTYPLLRDVVITTIQEVIPDRLIDDFNKNEAIMELVNGSVIYFRPLETEKQIDRLRGYSINWSWVDEAPYIPYYAIKVLNGRMREGDDQQMAVTGTPKGYNWAFEKFEEPDRRIPDLKKDLEDADDPKRRQEIKNEIEELKEIRRNWKAVKAISSEDNPFLGSNYLDSIQDQYSGDFFTQEIKGKFVKFEGLIYKEFKRGQHVIKRSVVEDMEFEEFIMGYDAGYSNPRVLLKIGRNEADQWVITKEFYRVESILKEVIPQFKEMGASDYPVYADPSAKGNIETMAGEGIMAEGADNEVNAGIQEVKNQFADNNLLISETCQNTINELMTYQWKGDPDDPKDDPLKESDHAMDALRYAIYSHDKSQIPMATISSR